RRDRRRTRQPIDGREFADNGARPDDGEYPLGAGRRDHADLEQAVLDAIAAVTRIAGDEQHLVGGEFRRLAVGEQPRRKLFRKDREQVGRRWTRHRRRRAGWAYWRNDSADSAMRDGEKKVPSEVGPRTGSKVGKRWW